MIRQFARRAVIAGAAVLALAAPTAAAAGTVPIAKPAPGIGQLPPPKGYPTQQIKGNTAAPKGNPLAPQTRATACSSPCYHYARRSDSTVTPSTGAQLTMSVHKPTRRSWDYHTLVEMSVQNASNNFVEAGWTVDPSVNGDSDPHLFVYHWVNGVGQGYNTNFSVLSSGPTTPGANLASLANGTVTLAWEYFDNATCACTTGWWLSYDDSTTGPAGYVGVLPATNWTSQGASFTGAQFDYFQAFGELVSSQQPSQSGMGNNQLSSATQGAEVSGYGLLGTGAPAAAWTGTNQTDAEKWNVTTVSSTGFRYGGPGGWEKILSTTTPSADDCSGTGTGTNPSGQGAFCTYSNQVSNVPVGKVTQIDGVASTACRGNVGTSQGYAAIRNVAMTLPWQVDFYNTAACTGTPVRLGHGRIILPAAYQNTANASYKILGSAVPAACATNGSAVWPNYKPTC